MPTSRSLNKVMLIGNLTRDPLVRTVGEKGSLVCTFGVATNSTWRDVNGEVQERAEFHNIVAWNKLGEIKLNDMRLLDAKSKKGIGLEEAKLRGSEQPEEKEEGESEVSSEEKEKSEVDEGEDLF